MSIMKSAMASGWPSATLTLTFLHTPGHTPEHISILAEAPGQPARLFTGDLLFVGGVGRPDLLGEAQTRQLANDLFDSLTRVMAMDDAIEVHPGHGAGSLCGAGIGQDPSTTIARERAQNAMLQHRDRPAFVAAVLADIPETPAYFSRMKRVNQQGPPVLGLLEGVRRLPVLAPPAAAALAADGAIIVDLRQADAFAAGHPDGALNLGYGSKVGYWAGWIVPPEAPLILLADEPAQAQDALVQLLRVGLDRVEGAVAGGFRAWASAGLPTAELTRISAADLRNTLASGEKLFLLDVRTPKEWRTDHIENSINIPVGDLPARLASLPEDVTIATICEAGYRSSLAASLLAQEGRPRLVNIDGGMAAYRSL